MMEFIIVIAILVAIGAGAWAYKRHQEKEDLNIGSVGDRPDNPSGTNRPR